MGDPSGIGPEIVVKALSNKTVYDNCAPVVYGDYDPLFDAIGFCKTNQSINLISDPADAKGTFGIIDLIPLKKVKFGEWEYKKVSKNSGEAAFSYIVKAIDDAMNKKIDAVTTGPINKESLHLAGHNYSGHTEIFADYTNTKNYAMLLTSKSLRVIHVTTHVPLRVACDLIKKDRILKVIEIAHKAMLSLGIKDPKIAVAGLNPHASENGLFGFEEANEIIPAVEEAKKAGFNVEGPVPPDTVFVKASSGQYDIVVAMYHDQGHIPLKLSGFKLDLNTNTYTSMSGVNCTLGLPIIRTSVDHGTAFGKAGEGRANEESMIDAIEIAIKMATNL
jgi:4-hydroxythreonine-4-phosphate dehydrogenase